MVALVREIQKGDNLVIFIASGFSHLRNYHLHEGEIAGESDERPLRGKAMIPKGKLNHPAVRVLDAENVILGNNPNLSLQFQRAPLLSALAPRAAWREGTANSSMALLR